jgi:GNAT superfamily N-acetyltransferase
VTAASATEATRCAIRAGRDSDADDFITLIGTCWAEYPGTVFDVDAELPELRALATYCAGKEGALWAAEANGHVVGMIAIMPESEGAWEICRMYVLAPWRGTGLAHRLLDQAEAHARAAGATRLKLWSDTRFDRAHRFYERRGYVRAGPIRVLQDLSNSLEFGYAKPVHGVETLDAAAAFSAERCLAEVLIACVNDGVAESCLPTLRPEAARAFWRRKASEVANGGRVLLAGWADGALAGCVMLDLDTPANQQHRAEVQTLLVHPLARRRGLARALMRRLEAEAGRAGRVLLTLGTNAGDGTEALYRAEGWSEAGRIPGYALNADGTPCDRLYFWKRVTAESG